MTASMSVTLLYAGLNALILLTLAILTVRARVQTRTDIGTGDNVSMVKAVRAHGNAAEYVPLALLLIAALEIAGAPHALLHGPLVQRAQPPGRLVVRLEVLRINRAALDRTKVRDSAQLHFLQPVRDLERLRTPDSC